MDCLPIDFFYFEDFRCSFYGKNMGQNVWYWRFQE